MNDERELLAALRRLYVARDEEIRNAFDRSLPYGDGLVDRWERAARLGFGEGASIYDSALVLGDVRVGEHTWIGPGTVLDGSGGGLRIGSYCSISAGVHLYTHDTVRWSLSMGKAERAVAPVVVGDGCHLGAQAVIAAGTSIGDRCVVGANAFVKGHVPSRAVVVGSPVRIVGMVRGEGADVEVWIGPEAVAELERPESEAP